VHHVSFARLIRLWLLTQQALREAAHLRLGWVIVLTALALTAGVAMLDDFNFGTERTRFLADMAEGTLVLFGTAMAVTLSGELFYRASSRELGPLLVCGVRRSEWLLARLLAVWIVLAWLTLAVLALTISLLGHEAPGLAAPLAARFACAWMQLALVTGFALTFCCLCRSPLLAALLSFGFTVAAHLAPVIAWSRRQASGVTQAGWTVLDTLLPNFAVFDPATGLGGAIFYAASYASLYFLAACFAFVRREL
jgi:hypothetical protein